jgi:putative ABC transport system permease protein
MLTLALRGLLRRPMRSALTLAGLAIAVAVLGALSAFGTGYRSGLHRELDRMGMQMMLVPLGCPYDAAARVVKGRMLDNSLPQAALDAVRRDPAVAVAAPMLIAALPRPSEGRTDMWVGLDRSALTLKPWWRPSAGAAWFPSKDSVILSAEAAEIEMRAPGDRFYSPETRTTLTVAGTLERSGVSDDSLFFVPLARAQAMFHQPRRLTAIAIRLKDPGMLGEASVRLQKVPGAQVVTLTEMMGVFLNLVGSVRALLVAIAAVAIATGLMGVFNTLLGNVVEQMGELSVMRALGASRGQVFGLVTLEALALSLAGAALGVLLAAAIGPTLETLARQLAPLSPTTRLLSLSGEIVLQCLGVGVLVGLLAGLYPAWQASRAQPAAALTLE